MSTSTKIHSKLGIAACLLAFAVWIYVAIAVYLFFYVDGFTDKVTELFVSPSNRIADLRGFGVAVVILAVVFLLIPAVGHLFGIIISLVGIFRNNKKKLFPTLGLILNLLPLGILIVLYVLGSILPAK